MDIMKRVATHVWVSFVKALLWALLAGAVYWAVTQWAPVLNAPWFDHLTHTLVISTGSGYIIVGG